MHSWLVSFVYECCLALSNLRYMDALRSSVGWQAQFSIDAVIPNGWCAEKSNGFWFGKATQTKQIISRRRFHGSFRFLTDFSRKVAPHPRSCSCKLHSAFTPHEKQSHHTKRTAAGRIVATARHAHSYTSSPTTPLSHSLLSVCKAR
jgi:hypothetical protein